MPKACNIGRMGAAAFTVILLFISLAAVSQFYYKDIISTRDINNNFRLYKSNKVSHVKLTSFQGDVQVTEGFTCEQRVNLQKNQILTYTLTADRGESFLLAQYNNDGLLVKTTDSSESIVSTTLYQYDGSKRLIQLEQQSSARDKSSSTSERHEWQYSDAANPLAMLRIRNGTDTTRFRFVVDGKGNVIEESGAGNQQSTLTIYYYYDDRNRLTDVVRYSTAAKRLLPDYIFEYEETGELASMTIVPEGSTDYQKWYYTYDDNGLKSADFCYSKRKELLGKVEYDYTAGDRP